VYITCDGELVTPQGSGTVTLDAGEFEAFPLPELASKYLSDGYKSYFVEVEPGIKIQVLEVGSGFPVFLQHGNPTSGFLYRKVAAELPTDHLRVIMPTLAGLGFFLSIFEQLPNMQGNPDSMPPEVTELYGKPVLNSGNSKAPLAMMRMVTDGPDHVSAAAIREIEQHVQGLDIPAEIVWGMNDPILAKALPLMKQNFPNAPVTETQGGHFLQEEVPVEIAAALLRVIDQAQLSEVGFTAN
jgi:pimeloyl-ACP methyl ester carboxylesterase